MDNSRIEWTDATWNPLRGCTRVSEGCRNCYAEAIAARFSGPGQAYEGLAEMHNGAPRWTGKMMLAENHLLDPIRWKRPRKIFVNSMSDLFHESVPDEWIYKIFSVMRKANHHVFQVLTKRPKRMLEIMSTLREVTIERATEHGVPEWFSNAYYDNGLIDRHIWLGVSVEDQKTADARIPLLIKSPAGKRFLSCEPLLGPIKFKNHHWPIDWVIVGGESGSGARPMHPDWARSLRDQCKAAGVSFFFKQWGEYAPIGEMPNGDTPGCSDYHKNAKSVVLQRDGRIEFAFPEGAMTMLKIGKHAAGRLLDGCEYSQFPEVNQ